MLPCRKTISHQPQTRPPPIFELKRPIQLTSFFVNSPGRQHGPPPHTPSSLTPSFRHSPFPLPAPIAPPSHPWNLRRHPSSPSDIPPFISLALHHHMPLVRIRLVARHSSAPVPLYSASHSLCIIPSPRACLRTNLTRLVLIPTISTQTFPPIALLPAAHIAISRWHGLHPTAAKTLPHDDGGIFFRDGAVLRTLPPTWLPSR